MSAEGDVRNIIDRARRFRSNVPLAEVAERHARERLINPMLEALGWPFDDMKIVRMEYAMDGAGEDRADYALFSSAHARNPRILIEAKRPGGLGDAAVRQLLRYCGLEGVPFGVLTDGLEWRFYLANKSGKSQERQVASLTLAGGDEADEAEEENTLRRYLEYARVKENKHIAAAEEAYKAATQKRSVDETLPRAWRELLANPDERMIAALIDATERLCRHRPAPEVARAFIRKGAQNAPPAAPPPQPGGNDDDKTAPPSSGRGGRRLPHDWIFKGVKGSADSAAEALPEILRLMRGHCRDKDGESFLARLAKAIPARVKGAGAEWSQSSAPKEVADGWYVDVHSNTATKVEVLRLACKIAGLKPGEDLILIGGASTWRFPSPRRGAG